MNKGFQVLDQYWCRHTSPHEVSGAQCLSRRLVLAVFELVFVFSLGGPTPSEAAGGRPLTQRSKTLGPASCRVSSVDCRVRAAIARVIRGGLRTSNDAQKNGPHKCRLKDRHGTTDETRPADTPTPMRHGAALCGDRHTGRRTMHTVIACHAPAPTSGGRGAPANSSGEPACAAR